MNDNTGYYNKWKYKIVEGENNQPIKLEVHPDFEINPPRELCKYFSFNDYNIDIIKGKYFYGSHPFELNDPFDLNKNLLKLNPRFQNELYQLYFSKFGILSMTESATDPLMWSHYCSHRGFVINYLIHEVPNNFFGPFPINYIEKFVIIESDNPLLTLLIASNIKYKEHWEKEKEWRFLLYSPKRMKLPKFIQYKLNDRCTRERYFYHKDSFTIKEIVLGYKLLLNENVRLKNHGKNGYTLFTTDMLLVKFLNLLYCEKIKTSRVDIDPHIYSKFIKQNISIAPLGKNRFALELID